MKDNYGRPVTSIRISVTNDCDLDCFYCHREGCLEGNREMAPSEIGEIVRIGTEFGIEKVKLTGGEPLMSPDIIEIVSAVNQPPINDVSLTTNGTTLAEKSGELKEAGLDRINISLDTLNPEVYEEITGEPKLNQVLDGIDAALDAGLWPVKLNMIVLNGVNNEEIEQIMEYSLDHGTILQIIELLWTQDTADIYKKYHASLDSIEEKLKERAGGVKTRWLMQARRKYLINGGEVEIVNPMHNSEFCAHCTRIRMTPDGYLKPCLMRNDNLVDILTPIRAGDEKKVRDAFREAISRREPYYKG
ncbi:molybdenum cofactor biosynthesis protein MoeA [candidate division MSBL1 archaeon SCGC-AAA261O19]|uniref:Probable GTP 3',8-cyclase n=2 Tax=candidate division MSBL1 TaxID=215777 RepID=A0A133UZU7_9EURY|nr:molybdenum cofactor biosynthesis protein MoeA [candidate division MSBL1 archaeon SCGC-AAA261C02]KXB03427.1 molybdenum cofactor biosynthesis protein MoeA [candidate division MSBL1 archaeon SCGC-AAA261O19]